MTSLVLARFQQNEIQSIKRDKGLDFLWCHHFYWEFSCLLFCAFFQWSNCWQEPQGLMQPSYLVHERCLQRYRFPRLALFSKAESAHCQNSNDTFRKKAALECSRI